MEDGNLTNLSPETRVMIRDVLAKYFALDEIKVLAFDLGIDYDAIGGNGKNGKIIGLLRHCERSNSMSTLVEYLARSRPDTVSYLREIVISADNPQWSIPALIVHGVEAVDVQAEVKLVIVGDGNVGKTSLVGRLVFNGFNPGELTTRGVAITRWDLALPHESVRLARMNIWDFGGQGSMHATHPYFFSSRAVYVLVLNVREDDRGYRSEYWLRLIRAYGGDSPIVIVANKIDEFPAYLDERALKTKYPSIIGFARTSCATGEGLDSLRDLIARAVCSFHDITEGIPANLARVKRTLEGMTEVGSKSLRDTLSVEEYEDICEGHGVLADVRMAFLRRLNDIGVMLYFGEDPRLDLNVVLNPLWVTDGIYRIINHESLADSGGRLPVKQIRHILPQKRYPKEKAMYILDMMRKFELCFPLNEQQTEFLLPDLLPPQEPALPEFDRSSALQFQYEYTVWQSVILTRLLVRMYHYIVDSYYWRNGVLLQSMDKKNRALIIADETDRRLRIWVDGEVATRRSLLNRIREEMQVIHENQREESINEWVVVPQGGEVPYQLLVNLEAKGVPIHYVQSGREMVEVNVQDLLNGVRADVIPSLMRINELIVQHFSLSELDGVCFDLDLSLDDIEGEKTLDVKARELVRKFERLRKIPELMAVLRRRRPTIVWQ